MPTRSTGGVTTPWEKYIFHYLPGIPVLIGLCIIKGYDNIETISSAIGKLPLGSNDSLLGVTFFLILLIMVLFTVFLLAMLVDAVRHMFEYAFLTPLEFEDGIAKHIWDGCDGKVGDLERKFNIITKYHETEYFYTEFFGNVAFSLFFLWGVMYWYGNTYLPGFYILWMHIVFILRAFFAMPIWKDHERANLEKKSGEKEQNHFWKRVIDWLRNSYLWYRTLDFSATIATIFLGLWWWFWCNKGMASIEVFHYYFIMTLVIMSSFEVYIFRFRRFEKTLKGILREEKDNRYQ